MNSCGRKTEYQASVGSGILAGIVVNAGWELDALGFVMVRSLYDAKIRYISYGTPEAPFVVGRPAGANRTIQFNLGGEGNVNNTPNSSPYKGSFTVANPYNASIKFSSSFKQIGVNLGVEALAPIVAENINGTFMGLSLIQVCPSCSILFFHCSDSAVLSQIQQP